MVTDLAALRPRSLRHHRMRAMAGGITDSSLAFHLRTAQAHGITRAEIAEIITHAAFYMGWPRAWAAFTLAHDIWSEAPDDVVTDKSRHEASMIFPIGEPNSGYAQYFSGHSYLAPVCDVALQVMNVTFEPGCVNNWHIHHATRGGGQVLICVGEQGLYQAWGEERVTLRPGDSVTIPAGVKHWHGAAEDSWFSHLAIAIPGDDASTEWLEPVKTHTTAG